MVNKPSIRPYFWWWYVGGFGSLASSGKAGKERKLGSMEYVPHEAT